jgi:hypothetical protein
MASRQVQTNRPIGRLSQFDGFDIIGIRTSTAPARIAPV